MTADDSYSIKEMISEFRQDVKSEFLEVKTEVEKLNNKVGIQNGRVTKTEEWSKEAQKMIEISDFSRQAYAKDKAWAKGVLWIMSALMVVVPTVCTILFGLSLKNRDYEIDKKIQTAIVDAFDNKVKSAEYEK